VVAASGLNEVIAPFTVSRLLINAGVVPQELTPEALGGALPSLETGLGVYLRDAELASAMDAIRALAA
jgi:hypothetical protein